MTLASATHSPGDAAEVGGGQVVDIATARPGVAPAEHAHAVEVRV